jgi:hypothetical protein
MPLRRLGLVLAVALFPGAPTLAQERPAAERPAREQPAAERPARAGAEQEGAARENPARDDPAQPPLRPCRRADLLGHWQVIRSGIASGASPGGAELARAPFQRYVFHPDATMAFLAAATPPTEEQELAFARGPAVDTWTLQPGGRLLRQPPGAARVQTSECRVVRAVLRDSRSPVLALPGDVVLTDQDEASRPIARRLLRKLPSGE